jgi:putative transcriptional regulator
MAEKSLDDLMRAAPQIDPERIARTTEAEIRRQALDDGEDPDSESSGYVVIPRARDLRRALDMTQDAFAALLRGPVGTVRNWEQGRTLSDPAARSLLALVAADPAHAIRVLSGRQDDTGVRRTG